MASVNWDIRREGRAWCPEEVESRYSLTPEKIELVEGKLFWSDEERLNMLALLLENIGIDKAIHLGDPNVWREAISSLEETHEADQ